MLAEMLKGSCDTDSDLLLVKLDEHSFSFLNSGDPIRVAFFMDNKVGEPWFARKSMAVIIGKNLDLDLYRETYKDKSFKTGLVEKTYLKFSVQQIRKKLVDMAKKELEVLGVSLVLPGPQGSQQLIGDTKEMASPLKRDEVKAVEAEVEEDTEILKTDEVASLLGFSIPTIARYVRMGKLKTAFEGGKAIGYWFSKSYIEKIKKCPPPWLKKTQIRSIKRRQYKGSEREKAEGRQKVIRRIKKDMVARTIPSTPSQVYDTCRRGGKMVIEWKKKRIKKRRKEFNFEAQKWLQKRRMRRLTPQDPIPPVDFYDDAVPKRVQAGYRYKR